MKEQPYDEQKGKDPSIGAGSQEEVRDSGMNPGAEQPGFENGPDDELSEEEAREVILDQQDQIRELQQQLDAARDSQLRKAAELDNVRKRIERDRMQVYEKSKGVAIEAFLPVYDDLQRTLQACQESGEELNSALLDGVRLVAEKFREALQQFNVEPISETGIPFDVNLHDALLRQPAPDDSVGSDVVLQILENGYRMGDRTIRHAKVIVSE
ncbi:MAG: nucleotide exchange factor GrpE [Balneolaceae bacterium]